MFAFAKRLAAVILIFAALSVPASAQSGTNEGWPAGTIPQQFLPTASQACQVAASQTAGIKRLENVTPWPPLAGVQVDWCKRASYKCWFRTNLGASGTLQTGLTCPQGKVVCMEQCVDTGTCPCDPVRPDEYVCDPVLPLTGELREVQTDYASGGSNQLRVDRTYRSRDGAGERFGLLGNRQQIKGSW